MKIIIGHYHLHPGGVTRIIDSQIKSLKKHYQDVEIEIICGNTSSPQLYQDLDVPVSILPNLDYMQNESYNKEEAQNIYKKLYSRITSHLEKQAIIHFHNLNLGKNPVATYCMYNMAKEGFRVFNHTHDFPEDRPENLNFLRLIIEERFSERLEDVLYPKDIPAYRLGVINTADQQRVIETGFPPEKITYLPNPVSMPNLSPEIKKEECRTEIVEKLKVNPDKLIITYPVRVIRRKNIGELILLSELFKKQATFLVTLAPKNPVELKFYEQWIRFCKQNNLENILFEVNQFINFERLVRGSDFCITTSIREGFGMTYMEPWLFDTPVAGRNIDYITRDFTEIGMKFPNLYNQINVPGKNKDFMDLSMDEQMAVILNNKQSVDFQNQTLSNNPGLFELFKKTGDDIIEKNKKIIRNNYSFEVYGKKIMETYRGFFE